jgi:hypothetical protein
VKAKAMEWLKTKAPGFNQLSEEELSAIADFTLLWTLFECRILNNRGNAKKICEAVEAWPNSETSDAIEFDAELQYFRNRYFANGTFTEHYGQLKFRPPDKEELVNAVISGKDADPVHILQAALIIVFRYRNNFFHGLKWQYELKGQLENFSNANSILKKVLERH